MTEEKFTSYEMMLIIDPTLGDDRTKTVIEELKSQIKTLGGDITFEDFWGNRDLSYRIKKNDKGFYVVLYFNLPPSKLLEISNELRLNSNVIRFITIKTPKNYEIMSLEKLEKESLKFKKENKEKIEKKVVSSKPQKSFIKNTQEEIKESPAKEDNSPTKVEEELIKEEEIAKEELVQSTKESKITDLDDVDEKLKSIIDDPDISL